MTVKTRFAPSPTGNLHLGNLRTALYSWLFAKKHGGTFILRIEDTDLERSTPESIQSILQDMQWLGLSYDEGPYYQTQRFDLYREIAEKLVQKGQAYYCYCSKERVEELRNQQMAKKEKPRYDGLCRDKNHSYQSGAVIRFRNPLEGHVSFLDQVYGEIIVQNSELDDLVIVRGDGSPTYNFTVVVDDWDMNVTHVVRGDDHINNTPRQINLLKALNAHLPIYAHLPTILGPDGKRLSKRNGVVSIAGYREAGYLPEALLNYLVRLGWSYGDQEVFSLDEMIHLFDLNGVHKSPAAFNIEKLQWLNQHYLKTLSPESVVPHFRFLLKEKDMHTDHIDLAAIIQAQAERCKTLQEMLEKSTFLFGPIQYDKAAVEKFLTTEAKQYLTLLLSKLLAIKEWQSHTIHQAIHDLATELNIGLAKIAQPLRVALTGGTTSPSIDVTVYLLGKEKVAERLNNLP